MVDKWNPVAGLREISYRDLRKGDRVVLHRILDGTYEQQTIAGPVGSRLNNKYYLLKRATPPEPSNIGTVVKTILRTNVRGSKTYFSKVDNSENCWYMVNSKPSYKISWNDIARLSFDGNIEVVREGIDFDE